MTAILGAVRADQPLETVRRRCLRIGDTLGFIFGNGLMANFLGEYYGTGEYGPARADLAARCAAIGSALINGPFIHKLFKRFEGTVEVDGQALERAVFIGVGAATVREVGLGFKLNHRADDDVERFGVLAIHGRPAGLIPEFPAVYQGRGISPKRAFSAVASTLKITPKSGSMAYTIDGDIYKGEGPLTISVGPHIEFVKLPTVSMMGSPAGRPHSPRRGRRADQATERFRRVDRRCRARYDGAHAMSSSFPMDGMRVRFAGDSNVGMKRAHNEDAFYLPESERLAIVADGMGGHASGEVASRMAVDTIVGFFKATRTTSS